MYKSKFLPKAKVGMREQTTLQYAARKKVLHIGMGGYIDDEVVTRKDIQQILHAGSLHEKLAEVSASLTGLDINPVMIETMQKLVPGQYYVGDITDPELPRQIQEKFEVILFLDVIEHLDSFRSALQNIEAMLAPGGCVVISTCNAFCFETLLKMIFNYESNHAEHTSYFSYLTMKRVLEMNHFNLIEFSYTLQERRGFSSIYERIGFYLMKAASKLMPQFSQGFLFLAMPQGAPSISDKKESAAFEPSFPSSRLM